MPVGLTGLQLPEDRLLASCTTPREIGERFAHGSIGSMIELRDATGADAHRIANVLAISAGADVKVVQQMLGHADAAMAPNIYGHLFPDRLDEVAEVLDLRRTKALRDMDAA